MSILRLGKTSYLHVKENGHFGVLSNQNQKLLFDPLDIHMEQDFTPRHDVGSQSRVEGKTSGPKILLLYPRKTIGPKVARLGCL